MEISGKIGEVIYGKGSKLIDRLIPKNTWRNEYIKQRLWYVLSDCYKTQYGPIFRSMLEAYKGSGCSKGWLTRMDYWLCWVLLCAEPDDYFDYEFFKKGWRWRHHHVTKQRMNYMDSILNVGDARAYIENKDLFYERWNGYIKRKWCRPQQVSFEEFSALFGGLSRILVKPAASFGGKGIYALDINSSNLENIYKQLHDSKESIVAEEYVYQKGFLNDISPASLNPMRVTTLRIGNEVTVLYAFFTAGCNGNVVANDCSGGICYPIDTHTGEMGCGQGRMSNGHIEHPDTGIVVAGQHIPDWERIKEFACDAHRAAPEGLNLIGWDICWNDGVISLIEGNRTPGFPELPDPKDDMWKRMKEHLDRFTQMGQ